MTLASKSEFAQIIGKSKPYVTQLGDEGRLVMVGKLVDVEASQARIAATAAGTHPGVTARHAQERAQKACAGALFTGGEGAGMGEAEKNAPASIPAQHVKELGEESGRLMVRKMREMLMRDDRLIDLGLLRGEMMPRGDMNHLWHDMGVAIRAGLEAMIERLAPRLSASADGAAVVGEIRLAMVAERRRVKRLMVSSLKQTRESGK